MEVGTLDGKRTASRRAGRLGRWLRRAIGAAAAVAALYAGTVVLLGLVYSVAPPVSTLMLTRWLRGETVERIFVPLQEMGRLLPLAVIAAEDARFCRHAGVDWAALHEVIEAADEDGPSRGASTIPMQTAKNLFLWPGRSYLRKGLELPVALYLDLIWSKERMLEIYLNIAEWGEGVFGAEAAARHYFRKSARSLSRREAALLAKALPNPIKRNAAKPSPGYRRLAERLGARMERSGPINACLAD